MTYLIIFAVVIIGGLIAFFLVLPRVVFRLYSSPPRLKNNVTPAKYKLTYDDITFRAGGADHAAWLIFPPDYEGETPLPTVIAQHGFAANRSDIVERCAHLAQAGFLVFSFDWRAHGDSGGKMCSGGVLEKEDLLKAIEFVRALKEVDGNKVALYGFSMGASICIQAAALDKNIQCIVADSPYKNNSEIMDHVLGKMILPLKFLKGWLRKQFIQKVDNGEQIKETDALVVEISPRPILILAGTRDRLVPFSHPKSLFELAGEPKEMFVNKGGGHFDNASATIMTTKIIPFLKQHLNGEVSTGEQQK